MNDRRSILDRGFSFCVGLFMAALLVYMAVQLIISVLWWLVGGGLVLAAIGGALAVVRARSERW